MSTTPSSEEQRKAQQVAERRDLMQYVEELASPEEYPPGDAWMSLTDAARVTRTSFIGCSTRTINLPLQGHS